MRHFTDLMVLSSVRLAYDLRFGMEISSVSIPYSLILPLSRARALKPLRSLPDMDTSWVE